MSTVVYHGLPAFLESQHNESRTLRLKLASPRSHLPHSLEMAICTVLDSDSKILFRENSLNNGDSPRPRFDSPSAEHPSKPQLAGLSFLQTLPTIVQTPNEKYVHPLVKRALSALSDKSLELCTENLGSETGTDIMEDENSIFFPICPNAENGKIHPRKNYTSSSRRSAPKTFPPPLPTIMGSEAVRVRPIREDGRLILQAVKVQPRASCFQADRSNGWLRLRYYATDEKPINSARDDTANDEEDLDHGSNNSSDSESRNEQQDIPDSSTDEKDMGTWEGRCKEGGGDGNSDGLSVDSESRWVAASYSS